GRVARAATAVPEGPCGLRQREVPPAGGRGAIPERAWGAGGAALLAPVRAGVQPDRAGVVAPAGSHHPQPSLPEPGGTGGPGHQLAVGTEIVSRQGFHLCNGSSGVTQFPTISYLRNSALSRA